MAEFTKVAHEWVRMCKAYSDAGDCMKCPMVTNPICGCMSDGNGASDKEISKAESDIMSWAAEHPEPVYPTWASFLAEHCGAPKEICFGYITYPDETYGVTPETYVQWVMTERIPEDMARKLGIEPKEKT